MDGWIDAVRTYTSVIETYSTTAQIHKCRSQRLAVRVKRIFDAVAILDQGSINLKDIRVMGCLSMLLVTLEEIHDYFKILQQKDNTLAKRVKRFGSDDETFCKWNETLMTCFQELKLNCPDRVFDPEQDTIDYNHDMEDLKICRKSILEKDVAIIVSVGSAFEDNQRLLDQQHNCRSQYKTQVEMKSTSVFDVNAIRYEEIIGRGGRLEFYHRVWSSVES